MRKLHLARHPWFALTLVALLGAAPACDGDDDDGQDDGDDTPDDGQGTDPDAAPLDPDAAPTDPDAAPIEPDAAPVTTVTSIGVGNNVLCATLSTGGVRCWGANEQGQLGIGAPGKPVATPSDVMGIDDAASVDCGTATCCALTTSGGARCWGWNDAGALGANRTTKMLFNRPVADAVVEVTRKGEAALDGLSQVSVGGLHSCALRGDEAWCWGWNGQGQSGQDPTTTGAVLAATATGTTGLAALALAHVFLAEHSCAITSDGHVSCWGFNNAGQLGDGTTERHHLGAIVPGLEDVIALAAGQQHTCAVGRPDAKAARGVYCWGNDGSGQAGGGGLALVEVPGLDGATDLAAGQSHTCAVLGTGGVRCWGANNFGQLGNGVVAEGPHPEPTDVLGPDGEPLGGVAEVAAGFANTCARTVAGEMLCWGDNGLGQLGGGKFGGAPATNAIRVPVVPAP